MAIRAIEPLDPAFRHCQAPSVLDSTRPCYEWFYFEVDFEDDDGHPWRVITSMHHPHALDPRRVLAYQRAHDEDDDFGYYDRYGDHPASYAGLASYVVDVEENRNVALFISRFRPERVTDAVHLTRPGAPMVDLRFGDSSFREVSPGVFELKVSQQGIFYRPAQRNRTIRLEMSVTLEQNTPGFQPRGGVLLDHLGAKHYWACVLPNPKLTVHHVEVTRTRRLRRHGVTTLCKASARATPVCAYHDHQWGEDLIYRQIQDWSWGRVSMGARRAGLPRDKVLFFDINGIGSPTVPAAMPAPVIVELPGDGSPPFSLRPISGEQSFRLHTKDSMSFADGCRLGIQGQGVPYYRHLELRAQTPDGEPRRFDILHDNEHTVDTWPFYLRFLPRVHDAHSGETLVGISEYMRADRLTLPKTQRLLALSDLMTHED